MTPLFTKLNLKDCRDIVVLDAPSSFESELAALQGVTIRRSVGKQPVAFALAFVQTLAAVEAAANKLLPAAPGDPVIWFAYPKGTSKRYRCEFNRDNGWQTVGAAGFEPVRMVAIDEDWSALRFRRVEAIRVLQRDPKRAQTAAGKARATRKQRPQGQK